MKYLLTLIEKVHENWLNDDDYMYLIACLQSKIDKMLTKEALCANNAGHYLTLSDFNQAEIWQRKAEVKTASNKLNIIKMKTYLAINEKNECFICEAYSKKQMKNAGMNMKLDWVEYESYEKAFDFISCSDLELKNATNVSSFSRK